MNKKYIIDIKSIDFNVQNKTRDGTLPEIILDNVVLVSKREDSKNTAVDRLNTIVYPEFCSNLENPENVLVDMDFRHQRLDGAGYVFDMKLSEDKQDLLSKIKVGEQHILIDKGKKQYGYTYPSLMLAIAEKEAGKPENVEAGKTYKDFIPVEIWNRFFKINEAVARITGLSVELDWNTEPEIINGIAHIKQYSIVRVTFLCGEVQGQQQARLNPQNYKLRNYKNMEDLNKIQDNIQLFESGDLLKIRSAELSDAYLVYTDIKNRACAMCEAKMKAEQEALETSKKRSEEELQAEINDLKAMFVILNARVEEMKATQDAEIDTTRDAEVTPDITPEPGVETPAPEVEPPVVQPTPAEVEKTRMAKEENKFNINQY